MTQHHWLIYEEINNFNFIYKPKFSALTKLSREYSLNFWRFKEVKYTFDFYFVDLYEGTYAL